MATLQWAHICEKVLVEQDTQNVSLIRLLERATVHKAPGTKISKETPLDVGFPITVVAMWGRTKGKPEKVLVRSTLRRPDGKAFGSTSIEVDLTLRAGFRSIVTSPGFQVTGPGSITVTFEVSADGKRWRSVATRSFEVVIEET